MKMNMSYAEKQSAFVEHPCKIWENIFLEMSLVENYYDSKMKLIRKIILIDIKKKEN